MRIAHLLLTHMYNAQLVRLLQRLAHNDADIYIHIDHKAAIEQFEQLKKIPRVYFINKREKVFWGAFSIVQATINGLEAIMASGKDYGYINLLSGQDYPLKPAETIHSFLAQNPGKMFTEYYLVDDVWTEAKTRITQYHLTNYNFTGKYVVQKWMNKLLPQRRLPYNLVAVGRSQWFTIATPLVAFILDYIKTHPRMVKFFKLSWAPDELFFQIIIYNSPYKDKMVNDNLRYIDFSEGKASPKTLTINDVPALTASGKFYARKFNAQIDAAVLDELDKIKA